jgi:hypothetical protein
MAKTETDPDRELDRFEEYFELETDKTLKEEDDFGVIKEKLNEWLDEIELYGESRAKLAEQIIMAMREQRRMSRDVQRELVVQGRKVVEKLVRKKKWTARDIRTLQMYYSSGADMNLLSSRLERSKGAIYHKAARLDLKRRKLDEAT